MGPDFILLNLSVEFNDAATTEKLETRIAHIDKQIKEAYPEVTRIFIEAETAKSV